jgi:hypothetical protein
VNFFTLPMLAAVLFAAALRGSEEQKRLWTRGFERPANSEALIKAGLPTAVDIQDTPCSATASRFCFADTAFISSDALEPNPQSDARAWFIVFASRGDSIEIRGPKQSSLITNIGQERTSANFTANYFRRRLDRDQAVEIWVDMDAVAGDSVSFVLNVQLIRGASDGPRLSGAVATLRIAAPGSKDAFSLLPATLLALRPRPRDWAIHPNRTYKIALADDSLYQLCRIPCVAPEMIILKAGHQVLRHF